MYHLRFKGSHYEIGFNFGSKLKKRNISILSNVPFPITEKHINFAKNCFPMYKKFFPEILDEIRGVSNGQQCDYDKLIGILFSMYCIMPSTNCSCFVTRTIDNNILLGRNSDFLVYIEKFNMNTLYKFTGESYNFNGNTTAFIEIEDGMNEHGLAVGITSVAPLYITPGMLVRLFLEKCKTVQDVISLVKILPIASSQTIVVADSLGNGSLIECNSKDLEVLSINDVANSVYSTNMFNTQKMINYNNLPDDNWLTKERYKTLDDYFLSNNNNINLKNCMDLLSGKNGFLCQYNRKTGKDTVWSVIYNTSNKEIFRAEGNPSRKKYIQDIRNFNS